MKGKLAGCDIETYLLEKARITFQQEVERSYHIFYQMMQPAVGDLKKKCLLSNDIYDYHYVSQGKTKVQSIDDNEDLEFTHEAFQVLLFSEQEMWNVYKATSAVMNLGELVNEIDSFSNFWQLSPKMPEITESLWFDTSLSGRFITVRIQPDLGSSAP